MQLVAACAFRACLRKTSRTVDGEVSPILHRSTICANERRRMFSSDATGGAKASRKASSWAFRFSRLLRLRVGDQLTGKREERIQSYQSV